VTEKIVNIFFANGKSRKDKILRVKVFPIDKKFVTIRSMVANKVG